jgi:hypothetical protein
MPRARGALATGSQIDGSGSTNRTNSYPRIRAIRLRLDGSDGVPGLHLLRLARGGLFAPAATQLPEMR